jgi:DNA-binding response OmpR family regulator
MALTYRFPPKSSPKVLVAADDAQVRKYLQEALSRAGYASDSCSDRSLLDARRAAGHAFLMVNDGIPGREVLRRLRKGGATLPVILLSSGPGQEPETEDGDSGRVEHLSTPFTLATLQSAIDRILPT